MPIADEHHVLGSPMGLNYSINLYFPFQRIGTVLVALSRMDSRATGPSTVIRLPGHQEIAVPFTSDFKNEPVSLQGSGSEVRLDTGLVCPVDDAIREAWTHNPFEVIDGKEYADIGYIYLTVRLGCLFAEFSFTAATSGMSRLFVQSDSIRGRYRELLADCGGVASWLDQESFEYHRLEEPSQTFCPAWEVVSTEGDHVRRSVDWDTIALSMGLGRPLPEASLPARWRTPSVMGIARAIREERAFDRLPILADALEDAGCDNEEILRHCRGGGPHLQACWVVEALTRPSSA